MNPLRRLWLRGGAVATLGGVLEGAVGAALGKQFGQTSSGSPAPEASNARTTADTSDRVRRGRALVFPRDHGAHLAQRIEWWYVTGWLLPEGAHAQAPLSPAADAQRIGFQVTFFRSRTGLAEELTGRFAPRQLLFAHAALTEVATGAHRHDQRLARWSGERAASSLAHAAVHDADLALGGWTMRRGMQPDASRPQAPLEEWHAQVQGFGDGTALALRMSAVQPVLLQGDAGFSRKGPQETQASHYLTVPQLEVRATLSTPRTGRASAQGPLAGTTQALPPGDAASRTLRGRAWLDHEWSDELLHPQAVGWDWIGMNLEDGSALTAFALRRADGSTLWAGGSLRRAGGPVRTFGPAEVRWTPGRLWASPGSGARYPVSWTVDCPAGRYTVQALADAQELDNRASTGTVYWEGLSALLDAAGRRVGLGYLEMTGYAGRLVI